jgi:hypothetical protein
MKNDFQKHVVSFETPSVLSFRLCYFSTAILENDKKSVLFEQARAVSRQLCAQGRVFGYCSADLRPDDHGRPWRQHD